MTIKYFIGLFCWEWVAVRMARGYSVVLGFQRKIHIRYLMSNLLAYFNSDFNKLLGLRRDFELRGGGVELTATLATHHDYDANVMFGSVFIPENEYPVEVFKAVLRGYSAELEEQRKIEIQTGHIAAKPEDFFDSRTLQFSGRIFIYYDGELAEGDEQTILALARDSAFLPVLRTKRYVSQRQYGDAPVAFISHDSRDKELIARPIAHRLMSLACPVWYDEFSLKVGDRLRDSIEKGLKECHRCILIVSKNFLANDGWTKSEFDSAFTREMIQRSDVLLPVWCDVTPADVFEYSPSLANRVAVNWAEGEDKVVGRLHQAISASLNL